MEVMDSTGMQYMDWGLSLELFMLSIKHEPNPWTASSSGRKNCFRKYNRLARPSTYFSGPSPSIRSDYTNMERIWEALSENRFHYSKRVSEVQSTDAIDIQRIMLSGSFIRRANLSQQARLHESNSDEDMIWLSGHHHEHPFRPVRPLRSVRQMLRAFHHSQIASVAHDDHLVHSTSCYRVELENRSFDRDASRPARNNMWSWTLHQTIFPADDQAWVIQQFRAVIFASIWGWAACEHIIDIHKASSDDW